MLDDLIREVIHEILTVVDHALVEAVGMHVAGEGGLFGGLEGLPGLV